MTEFKTAQVKTVMTEALLGVALTHEDAYVRERAVGRLNMTEAHCQL